MKWLILKLEHYRNRQAPPTSFSLLSTVATEANQGVIFEVAPERKTSTMAHALTSPKQPRRRTWRGHISKEGVVRSFSTCFGPFGLVSVFVFLRNLQDKEKPHCIWNILWGSDNFVIWKKIGRTAANRIQDASQQRVIPPPPTSTVCLSIRYTRSWWSVEPVIMIDSVGSIEKDQTWNVGNYMSGESKPSTIRSSLLKFWTLPLLKEKSGSPTSFGCPIMVWKQCCESTSQALTKVSLEADNKTFCEWTRATAKQWVR